MGLSIIGGVLLAFVLLAGFVLPKHVYVARRVLIDAPAELIFPDVGSLATWPEWTDWNTQSDPSYDPKPEGDKKLTWTHSQGGPGEQTLTESEPSKGIKYKIEIDGGKFFVEGRVAFKADGTRTYVTWMDSMDFMHSYVGRYMGATMDMMLGPKIEKSLLALKQRSEERAKKKGVVATSAREVADPALTPPPPEQGKPAEEVKAAPPEKAPEKAAPPPEQAAPENVKPAEAPAAEPPRAAPPPPAEKEPAKAPEEPKPAPEAKPPAEAKPAPEAKPEPKAEPPAPAPAAEEKPSE
jgi:hypothetical protein